MTRGELLFSVTLKDLEFQTFRAGGKGGQHQNKRDTGVRFIHHPSGARGESREERSQLQNKRTALKKLVATPQFKFWVAERIKEIDRIQTIEQWVDEQLADMDNLKIEYRDEKGNWTEVDG